MLMFGEMVVCSYQAAEYNQTKCSPCIAYLTVVAWEGLVLLWETDFSFLYKFILQFILLQLHILWDFANCDTADFLSINKLILNTLLISLKKVPLQFSIFWCTGGQVPCHNEWYAPSPLIQTSTPPLQQHYECVNNWVVKRSQAASSTSGLSFMVPKLTRYRALNPLPSVPLYSTFATKRLGGRILRDMQKLNGRALWWADAGLDTTDIHAFNPCSPFWAPFPYMVT